MGITITKKSGKYLIDRDPHCFTLSKYCRGTDSYDIIGYYTDLKYVIKHLINLSILDQEHHDKIVDVIEATCKDLAARVSIGLNVAQDVEVQRSTTK